MSGVIHVKDGGVWKAVNFGAQGLDVNHSGTWKEPTAYVKHSGSWKLVYPSTTTQYTTHKAPTAHTIQNSPTNPIQLTSGGVDYATWKGRANQVEGEYILFSDFNWSPSMTAGFQYGAVAKLKVSFDASILATTTGSNWIKVVVRGENSTSTPTSNITTELTTTPTTYTMDLTIATWGISNTTAGDLHLADGPIKVTAKFKNSTEGFDNECYLTNFKASLQYYYN